MNEPQADRPAGTDKLIRVHVLWAMGAGLIPVPLLDIAAVTGIQLDLLKQLAAAYGVDYSQASGKAFVSALTGSTFAAIGSSIIKAIPVLGSVVGGVSMSVLSGASTYAVGQVALAHLAAHGTLLGVDLAQAKRAYKDAFEQGKRYVSTMDRTEQAAAGDVYKALERLAELKQRGVITEAEFEAKKKELLDRL